MGRKYWEATERGDHTPWQVKMDQQLHGLRPKRDARLRVTILEAVKGPRIVIQLCLEGEMVAERSLPATVARSVVDATIESWLKEEGCWDPMYE